MNNPTPDVAALVAAILGGRVRHSVNAELTAPAPGTTGVWQDDWKPIGWSAETIEALARAYEALRVELSEALRMGAEGLARYRARADQAERDLAAARAALEVARPYVVDGVEDAKREHEMNSPYPVREARFAAYVMDAEQDLAILDAALKGAPDGE